MKTEYLAGAIVASVIGGGLLGTAAADNASIELLIKPLVVGVQDPLDFGQVAAGPTPGTVSVTPTPGTTNRSSTGGVDVVTASGFQALHADVEGQPGYTYEVVEPTEITVEDGFGNSMLIDNIVTVADSGTGGLYILDSLGFHGFKLGGTLNVGANQPAGTYEGTFDIIVEYE